MQKVTIIQKEEAQDPVTFQKISNVRSIIKLPDGGSSYADELEEDKEAKYEQMYPDMMDEDKLKERVLNTLEHGQFDILELVMQKFDMTPKSQAERGCFT